jgi:hypothetical protein
VVCEPCQHVTKKSVSFRTSRRLAKDLKQIPISRQATKTAAEEASYGLAAPDGTMIKINVGKVTLRRVMQGEGSPETEISIFLLNP